MQCPNCRLLNPPDAARCDCGYDFATGTMHHLKVDHRQEGWRRRLFLQYAISCLVGTVAFLALRSFADHSHVRPPLAFAVALLPAYFLWGMLGIEFNAPDAGTSAFVRTLDTGLFVVDALYYGAVVFLVWRLLTWFLRRSSNRMKAGV